MVYIPTLKPLGAINTVDESDPRYIAHLDKEIQLEDGARLRLNVYLPRTGGPKWPVLMTATPYGKDVTYADCSVYKESAKLLPKEHICKHLAWEAPSPAYWCPLGYVVVVCDHRGQGNSPGYFKPFSSLESDDYAFAISWAADQTWSTGKVGLTGISYLALNQWGAAARQPRGLACIVPWEGMADYYRDSCRHGGIYCNGLAEGWFYRQVKRIQYGSRDRKAHGFGPDSSEGMLTEQELEENSDQPPDLIRNSNFIDDDFFQDRMVNEDYSKIQVPLLSVGNWGGLNLHLRGNVLAYMRAGSNLKFLRIHTGRHDLPYYAEPYISNQKSFFDSFLKDDDYAGWKSGKEPSVSFAVRKGTHATNSLESELEYEWRDEHEWPLARTVYERRYIDCDKSLKTERPTTTTILSFKGFDGEGIRFSTTPAEQEYEICGHPSIRLQMSLTDHTHDVAPEMDIFVAIRKKNEEGEESRYTASTGDDTAVTFGWIRASHRALTSKPYPDITSELPFPTLSHLHRDCKEVNNGEVYDLQFELWPTNLVVQKGERLVVEVSPKDPEGTSFFVCNDPIDRNNKRQGGINNIHFGPGYENYLVLPIVSLNQGNTEG